MPMSATPIIVEDGTIISGANSFVSVDDAAQFLFDRGLVKQSDIDDADGEGLLRRGLDAFINLPSLNAYHLPLAEAIDIPTALIEAQIWCAYYIWLDAENDPANIPSQSVKREKVDVIEVEYMDGQSTKFVSIYDMPNVRMALAKIGCNELSSDRSLYRA